MKTSHLCRELGNERICYVAVSGWNTLVGSGMFILLYYLLAKNVHYLAIIVLSHVLCVVNNWMAYRWLVFQSRAPWFPEYIRFNLSSLVVLAFQFFGVWMLVGFLGFHPVISQLALVVMTLVVSYVIHASYSFLPKEDRN